MAHIRKSFGSAMTVLYHIVMKEIYNIGVGEKKGEVVQCSRVK